MLCMGVVGKARVFCGSTIDLKILPEELIELFFLVPEIN